MAEHRDVPPCIADNWKLNQEDLLQALHSKELERFDICSLSASYLDWQIEDYQKLLEEYEASYLNAGKEACERSGASSLTSASISQLVNTLYGSATVQENVNAITRSLSLPSISQILNDVRVPYAVLRSILKSSCIDSNDRQHLYRSVDLDEAVLANERYLRCRGLERNKDGKALVCLEDAEILFDNIEKEVSDGREAFKITRQDPPKGGLQVLDGYRDRIIHMQPNAAAFVETFERITGNILRELDWRNVFVAGGIVLTTLLHTFPSDDDEARIKDGDIDMYLYGLNPKEANQKVEEIFQVWKANLPSSNQQVTVVKNAKTILFLADYPTRRVQIILKQVSSPTEVLLNFDLDQCAVGFDGQSVLMLPRCARALETGYSTFTMDLIWGNHLAERRATQDERLFKYADRGFGVRILPSYVECLEKATDENIPKAHLDYHYPGDEFGMSAHRKYRVIPRKPNGAEPGLKTLKRIQLLGYDMVERFVFGVSELARRPDWMEEEEWQYASEEAQEEKDEVRDNLKSAKDTDNAYPVPLISISDLDGKRIHQGLPKRKKALGCFELWMRHCGAHRMHVIGEAYLDQGSMTSTEYDSLSGYDDLPKYQWNESFDHKDYVNEIAVHDGRLFSGLKASICRRLGHGLQNTGWRDYLTRRIRRVICGPDVQSVFARQIVLPIVIPQQLEDDLQSRLEGPLQRLFNITGKEDRKIIIPVHEHGQGTNILADLEDVTDMEGNVRYWIIDNETMWAGFDRVIDEIFELLWSFFHWHGMGDSREMNDMPHNHEQQLLFFANRYRDRLLTSYSLPGEGLYTPDMRLPKREAELFNQWALQRPIFAQRHLDMEFAESQMAELYCELHKYPPPDSLFWKEEDLPKDKAETRLWVDAQISPKKGAKRRRKGGS